MSLAPFTQSESLTLGVELELQLVNLSDYDLASACPDMLHLLQRSNFPGTVTPEVTDSMIEIATGIHTRHDSLLQQLQDMRNALVRAGDKLNVGICGGGTHPFQKWFERRIYPKLRFKEVSSLYGYLTKQFTIFGQHVHIGCTSGDQALFLLHALNRYVPHFIALSASSPYSQGVDTLFHSARLNSVFAFPLSGRAPFLLDWNEFEQAYFSKMEHTGIVSSMKDFYWDVRPKPEYGTLELRVCDTPLSVERAAALACYLQALCRLLLSRADPPPAEDDYLVYNYNRFQACRFGLDGSIVNPRTHESLSLREDIIATLDRLQPHMEALESQAALSYLSTAVTQCTDADLLRAHDSGGGMEGVVNAALTRFRTPDEGNQSI